MGAQGVWDTYIHTYIHTYSVCLSWELKGVWGMSGSKVTDINAADVNANKTCVAVGGDDGVVCVRVYVCLYVCMYAW